MKYMSLISNGTVMAGVQSAKWQITWICFFLFEKKTNHPRLNEAHESNYNDSEVNNCSTTMCMYRKNISKPIPEISSYQLISNSTN